MLATVPRSYREAMTLRTHRLLTFVVVLCSAVLTIAGGIRLIIPGSLDWVEGAAPGLAGRVLPEAVEATLGLAIGLAGLAVGLLEPAATRTGQAPTVLRIAVVVVAAVMILLTPGELIPIAGYSFVAFVVVGVVVLSALFVWRNPLWGVVVIAVIAAIATWVFVGLRGAAVVGGLGPAFVRQLPWLLYAVVYLIAAVALITRSVMREIAHRGSFAEWVLRHRTAVTVVAACCALPYSIARASWLTPWPLLAPSGIDFAEETGTLLIGLSLGAAMLSGGVLTLGLIRPWGQRFPRWMAGLGGRPVPISLAVVPASIVAALFTVGGVDLILPTIEVALSGGSVGDVVVSLFMFPFWLWGPLLALATWGYAMARRSDAASGPWPSIREGLSGALNG